MIEPRLPGSKPPRIGGVEVASPELTAVDVVRGFRGLRVLVIGDAMLDTYIEGTATRLCKEGPVPVLANATEEHLPGGAANTAANLQALGADVVFVGLVGADKAAGELRAALRQRNVSDRWLVEDETCATMRKTRVLAGDQYVVRYDEGETRRCGEAGLARLLRHLDDVFPRCDAVVIADYGYGAVSDGVLARLRELRRRPVVLAVDAKHPGRYAAAGATVLTPDFNDAWAAVAPGEPAPQATPERAGQVGRRLRAIIDAEHIAVTIAADGVVMVDPAGAVAHHPAHPVAHAGDVGAGDSFTAAMALAFASGANARQAARIAIDAAGIAVTKRRTAVVTHQELLRRVSLDDQSPGQPLKTLAAILDAERHAGKRIVFTNGIFDILHTGHVQILRRAKELGDVLVVGVNSDASTRRLKGPARPINHERDRLALVAALESVDHAILFDEDNPAELIRALRPHVHVKGGDYTPDALAEADAVRDVGARIEILSLVEGRSTTNVIKKIVMLAADGVIEAAP
jgi:D-beta-D-heptose 7-phosphate kinase / D-beta-D-heptose 1-phosphate adenosyltransferase